MTGTTEEAEVVSPPVTAGWQGSWGGGIGLTGGDRASKNSMGVSAWGESAVAGTRVEVVG